MPRIHRVPALEELALRSVGEFVIVIGKRMIQPICTISQTDPHHGLRTLQMWLQWLKQQLSSSVPWHLYDRMAVEALKAVLNLINETKNTYNHYTPVSSFLSEMNVVVNLTEVAIGSNLRSIDFTLWPKIMRHVLYKNLHNMTGLEVLDLGSGSAGWQTSDIEKIITGGVPAMPNLISFTLCFDCTDCIVAAVAQHCPNLQKLDVTASRSVTDRSITVLLKCWQLREIKLYRTSVTIAGYAELLLGHSRLEDIGRCDEFGYVLEHIRGGGNFNKPFHLKAFESRDVTTLHSYLLVEMCPYITKLSMLHDERITDLTILASLQNLTELKLLSCDFFADRVKMLLKLQGDKITSLHLEHVDEIDLDALMCISQFCPKIKNLVLCNCEFLEHSSGFTPKLSVSPFKVLERVKCVADCATMHLEFLLSHCTNIKFIQLSSSTGIGDRTMERILLQNPMKKLEELKILYSDDLSMKTVKLLMQNCENLRRLSELESWLGISSVELEIFRKELKVNNIDLDTSPTLSLGSFTIGCVNFFLPVTPLERYKVVTIDLQEDNFTPGKKNYDRVRECLETRLKQRFNVIIAWDPPDKAICPSSVAAWFHDRGYVVSLCKQKIIQRSEYSLKVPLIGDSPGNYDELFEWIGMFSIGANLNNDDPEDYVNSYVCPEPNVLTGQVRYLQWSGFFTRKQIERVYNAIIEYMSLRESLPWASLDVQGFADSPVSWGLKEHTFLFDGDNSITLVFRPNGKCILRTSLSSNNKPRIKQ